MTTEELLAWSRRLLRGGLDVEAEEAKAKATMPAGHRGYQWTNAELGRQLQLGPDDINPLDLNFYQEQVWDGPDDPRIEVWTRAVHLLHRLNDANMDLILW
jgi:hypothetical protein